MSNPTFKPSEGKREEFRTYLEKNGVMDSLTKVLVNLYEEPEKPEDALEYIRDRLAVQAGIDTFNQMKEKLDESQAKIDALTQELDELKLSAAPPEPAVEDEEMGAVEPAPADELPPEEAPPAEKAEDAAAAPEEQPTTENAE